MEKDINFLSDMRIDFLRDLGLIISDPKSFAKITQAYGYHEIINQYGERFLLEKDDDFKYKPGTTFEAIYAYYRLDQQLKNQMMISLQLFEQNFKVALTEANTLGEFRHGIKNRDPKTKDRRQFLSEKYELANGRVIRRGDIKARIRHIKQNYLEPYPDYRRVHGEVDQWVLFKEMSFGVATNYFFLMPAKYQKLVLARIFQSKMTLRQFESWLETIRYFQRRAAHNYRLIDVKDKGKYLYQTVLENLKELKNQEPYDLVKAKWTKIVEQYLQEHPADKAFLEEKLPA